MSMLSSAKTGQSTKRYMKTIFFNFSVQLTAYKRLIQLRKSHLFSSVRLHCLIQLTSLQKGLALKSIKTISSKNTHALNVMCRQKAKRFITYHLTSSMTTQKLLIKMSFTLQQLPKLKPKALDERFVGQVLETKVTAP